MTMIHSLDADAEADRLMILVSISHDHKPHRIIAEQQVHNIGLTCEQNRERRDEQFQIHQKATGSSFVDGSGQR